MKKDKNDPLQPPIKLLCKLGSLIVHIDEMLSGTGHAFDKITIQTLIKDDEVTAWLKQMDDLALIPKKR